MACLTMSSNNFFHFDLSDPRTRSTPSASSCSSSPCLSYFAGVPITSSAVHIIILGMDTHTSRSCWYCQSSKGRSGKHDADTPYVALLALVVPGRTWLCKLLQNYHSNNCMLVYDASLLGNAEDFDRLTGDNWTTQGRGARLPAHTLQSEDVRSNVKCPHQQNHKCKILHVMCN